MENQQNSAANGGNTLGESYRQSPTDTGPFTEVIAALRAVVYGNAQPSGPSSGNQGRLLTVTEQAAYDAIRILERANWQSVSNGQAYLTNLPHRAPE